MDKRNVHSLLSATALAVGLIVVSTAGPAAAKEVNYEACVVDRKPTSALMKLEEQALFELDLRPIPGTPFALKPGDCVTVTGIDRGNQPGLRREFPQASWLVEASVIAADQTHVNRGSHSSNSDED